MPQFLINGQFPGFSAGVLTIGGTGALGNVTIAASVNMQGIFNYQNLTINPAVTITIRGAVIFESPNMLHIKCTGDFTNSGTITGKGRGYGALVGATSTAMGSALAIADTGVAAGQRVHSTVGQTGWCWGLGGANGGGGGVNGLGGQGFIGGVGMFDGSGIGKGWGQLAGGQSGWTGNIFSDWPSNLEWPHIPFLPGAQGAPGAGDGTNVGGSTGAGGGILLLSIRGNLIEGTIDVSAENGGNAPPVFNCGGGGGGGGGLYVGLYSGTITLGTVLVAAGLGGTGTGTGSAGVFGGTGFALRQKV